MSWVARLKGRRGPSGFGYASTAEEVTEGLDLTGKNILITGVGSGLGQESARILQHRGARILGAARTLEKAELACSDLGGNAVPLACELSDPDSLRNCISRIQGLDLRLDVLLCNAGVMALPERTLVHGHELHFLTNHLGHFFLVTQLLDLLTRNARVVLLSSAAHRWASSEGIQFDDLTLKNNYSPRIAYGQSKLANLLFARTLGARFRGSQRTANAVHPGVIATNLLRHMPSAVKLGMPLASAIAMKSIPQGASTQCYVSVHPKLSRQNGEYFSDCNVGKTSRAGRDQQMAERLWEVSERIVESF